MEQHHPVWAVGTAAALIAMWLACNEFGPSEWKTLLAGATGVGGVKVLEFIVGKIA